MGNRIYGCDDCLAVCPWNKFAAMAREAAYWARIELRAPKLAHLAALDDAGFREVFSGSPIKRIGRDRFVRNVLYAIGNSGEAGLIATARRLARGRGRDGSGRGGLGAGAARGPALSAWRLRRARSAKALSGNVVYQVEPERGGGVGLAHLGAGGGGLEEGVGKCGIERDRPVGGGGGGGGVSGPPQRRGPQRQEARGVRGLGQQRVDEIEGARPVALRRRDPRGQQTPGRTSGGERARRCERRLGDLGLAGVEPEPGGVLEDRCPAEGIDGPVGVLGQRGQQSRGGGVGAQRLERRGLAEPRLDAAAEPGPDRGLLAGGDGVGGDRRAAGLDGIDFRQRRRRRREGRA